MKTETITTPEKPEVNNAMAAPVHISERAQAEIRETLAANKIPHEYGLRVGLRGGACSATYLLGFDTPTGEDSLYKIDGITVIIDRRHLMYVLGVTVDYEQDGVGGGFTISTESEDSTQQLD